MLKKDEKRPILGSKIDPETFLAKNKELGYNSPDIKSNVILKLLHFNLW